MLLLLQGVTALVRLKDRELTETKAQSQVGVYWNPNVVAWHLWVCVQRSQLALSETVWSAVRAKALFSAIQKLFC